MRKIGCLTFATLEGDQVTFEIQWFYNDFYKVKLALKKGDKTSKLKHEY